MNHAGHSIFILSSDREAVPAVTHGDYRIHQRGAQRSVDHGSQLRMNPFSGSIDLSSDLAQFRTRVVTDLIFGEDAAPDIRRESRHRVQQ